MLVPNEGCHSWNKDAKLLCDNADKFHSEINKENLQALLDKMKPDGVVYQEVKSVLDDEIVSEYPANIVPADITFAQRKKLKDAYQHRTVFRTPQDSIFIPYRSLVPLNVIFNWSIQNPSSYYTDIGFFWIITLVLLIIGVIYAIARRQYQLFVIQAVAVAGWILWWLIAHGIVWYAVGLMLWSIIANTVFLYYLYRWVKDDTDKILFYTLLILIGIFGLTQILFNYIRISAQ